jgi:hypothetical protein
MSSATSCGSLWQQQRKNGPDTTYRVLCARTRDTTLSTLTVDGACAGSSPGNGLTMLYGGDDDDDPDCMHVECMGEDECKHKDKDDGMGGMF